MKKETIKIFDCLYEYKRIINKIVYENKELTCEDTHYLVVDFPFIVDELLNNSNKKVLDNLGIKITKEYTGCYTLNNDEIPF